MKTTTLLCQLATAMLLTSLLTLTACKKESTNFSQQDEEDASIAMTQADAELDFMLNDVFDNVLGVNNQVGLSGIGIFGRTTGTNTTTERATGCFTVTTTPYSNTAVFPLKIVIDFGGGCPGADGHTRSGKITTTYTGRLTTPGQSATTTFEGYKIDSIAVEGTHTINNTGSLNQRQFTVTIENARLTYPSGNYVQRSSRRVITQVEGSATPEIALDDAFTITGSANGSLKKGTRLMAWQSEVMEPLKKRFTCRWISQGIIRVKRETLASSSPWTATLNYGNGDCDNRAVLIINGKERQITLY